MYDGAAYQFRFGVAYCVFIQLKISPLPVFHLAGMNTDVRLLFLRMSNVSSHLNILMSPKSGVKPWKTSLPSLEEDIHETSSLSLLGPWAPKSTSAASFQLVGCNFKLWFHIFNTLKAKKKKRHFPTPQPHKVNAMKSSRASTGSVIKPH